MNKKQEIFILEYVKDFNATQAAIRTGYSPDSAEVQGSRLLSNAKVQSEIQKFIDKRTKAAEISVDRILEEIACVAFSDIGEALHWSDAGISFEPSNQIPEKTRRAISEVSETITDAGGSKKMKFHNKMPALELLAKIKGMVTEKHEITAKPLHEEIKRAVKEIGE